MKNVKRGVKTIIYGNNRVSLFPFLSKELSLLITCYSIFIKGLGGIDQFDYHIVVNGLVEQNDAAELIDDGVTIEEIVEEEIIREISKANEFKEEGNSMFKKGDYTSSVLSYQMSLRYCPLDDIYNKERAIFLCNMAAAQVELKQYEGAVDSCTQAVELNPDYIKIYVRRSQAYIGLEKLDDCLADYDKILELDSSLTMYKKKRDDLSKQIEVRNEKMKDEMLGKLKDVGNKILGKFGMSLDNFKMVQDPSTGGYSVKYEK